MVMCWSVLEKCQGKEGPLAKEQCLRSWSPHTEYVNSILKTEINEDSSS